MRDQAPFVRDPKRAHDERRDFASAERLPRVVALAAVIGGISALAAWLLLHIKGYPGRMFATVGELAERLQAKPHGVVALVTRAEEHGFVERRQSEVDKRRVEIHLLPEGERVLGHLAELHRTELESLGSVFTIPSINR